MAKVFGVVPLELQPGVDEQEFFRFFTEEYAPLGARLGWQGYVLKADKGERAGKVAVIWEIQSVDQRDRFFASGGQLNEEGLRMLGSEFDELQSRMNTYVTGWPFTDYVQIGK